MSQTHWGQAAHCIYCLDTKRVRTDEHILPYSLGGRIVFEKASCKKCQVNINRNIEGLLGGSWYKFCRQAFGYRSRKGKNRDLRYIRHVVKTSAGDMPWDIPFAESLAHILIPTFAHPPFLSLNLQNSAQQLVLGMNPVWLKGTGEVVDHKSSERWCYGRSIVAKIGSPPGLNPKVLTKSFELKIEDIWRLALKVCAGIFYRKCYSDYVTSEIQGIAGSENIHGDMFKHSMYSAPRDSVAGYLNQGVVYFTVCENEQSFHYAGFDFLPEMTEEIYLMKIPNKSF